MGSINACEEYCAAHVTYYCDGTKETKYQTHVHHAAQQLSAEEEYHLSKIRSAFRNWQQNLDPKAFNDEPYSLPPLHEEHEHVRGYYRGHTPEPLFAKNPLGPEASVYFKTCTGQYINVRGQLRTGISAEAIIADPKLAKTALVERQAAADLRWFERQFNLQKWPEEGFEKRFILEVRNSGQVQNVRSRRAITQTKEAGGTRLAALYRQLE